MRLFLFYTNYFFQWQISNQQPLLFIKIPNGYKQRVWYDLKHQGLSGPSASILTFINFIHSCYC